MIGEIAMLFGVLVAPALFGFMLNGALYDSTSAALYAAGVTKGREIWQMNANPRSTLIVLLFIPFLIYMVFSQF